MKSPLTWCIVLMLAGAGLLLAPAVPWRFSPDGPPSPVVVEILSTDPGDAVATKFKQLYFRGMARELRTFAPRIGTPEFQGGFGPAGAKAFTAQSVPVLQAASIGFDRRVSALDQAIAEAKTPADKAVAVDALRNFFLDYAREAERIGR